MGEYLLYKNFRRDNQFKIDYPYYGLFGTADITDISSDGEVIYKCRLLNGTEMILKKLAQARKWIDAGLNRETPLSAVIGRAIDDFVKKDNSTT